MRRRAVTIIGMGEDGCVGLTSRAMGAVAAAQVLAGGERHLAFFPQFTGERVVLKDGVGQALDRIAALAAEHQVCVLASGDPLFFGIGALAIRKLGAEHVEVIPHPSAVQWAFARLGLNWDDATFISLHGRPIVGLCTRLRRLAKVACFTDAENSPARIAAHLLEHGLAGWRAWVCENLGGAEERVRAFTLDELRGVSDIAPLNLVILRRTDETWRPPPVLSFMHEEAFTRRMPKRGLITRREVRLLSLASLGIDPTSVVWDIGAGSGALSIEAAMLAYEGRIYAIEVDPEGVALCRDNARAHGVDNVRVIAGRAPGALADLETPDAVFVGGSKGSMDEIITVSLGRLPPGGRIVVNAITLENVSEAYTSFRRHDLEPEVTLLSVARGAPLAGYTRYEAQNPIHVFAATRPALPAPADARYP